MAHTPLYPLRFEPIFTTNLWGGRRLPGLLGRAVAHDDPVGEAWVLSDVDGSLSRVADGPLAGSTLREVLAPDPARVVGAAEAPQGRFPLLLKFLDARQELSVQVHPNDEQAAKLGPGKFGKTEAWVVLDADPATSKLYAGFAAGVSAADFRAALAAKTTPQTLHSFTPKPGDCVFLEAGTVHAIGANLLLFEVQQTSDITYRLYDWDRIDAKTGKPRQLHVDEGLACADFARGPCPPVGPAVVVSNGVRREGLVACDYFTLERLTARVPFRVGAANRCRAIVCVKGSGELESRGAVRVPPGDTFLLPAEVGECIALPTEEVTLLECGLPEQPMDIDLNADLGEGAGFDAELMPLVTSANVCCGLHAGGPSEIAKTLVLANRHGVAVGAHPGYADREHFGRRELDLSARDLVALCMYQLGAMYAMAATLGLSVRYVKPHGALYNQACRDRPVADALVLAAVQLELPVVGLPGSQLEAACRGQVAFVPEGFADRRYRPDGSLVPRDQPDAFVHDPDEAVTQVERLVRDKGVRTICVHGDNPEAVAFTTAVRAALLARGVTLKAFA